MLSGGSVFSGKGAVLSISSNEVAVMIVFEKLEVAPDLLQGTRLLQSQLLRLQVGVLLLLLLDSDYVLVVSI